MFISIVICTYNRADFLFNALGKLTKILLDENDFELIVVDNNSSDNTRKVVDEFSGVNYFKEARQGLSYARNLGYRVANGEWVAYLDDDAYVKENWFERLIDTIKKYNYDAFGGVYLPWYRQGKKSWYLDEYASNTAWMCFSEVVTLENDFFSGGNCVYRRSLLEEVGGFPPNIGMSGGIVSYGEEVFVQTVARKKGAVIGFDPHLIIYHYASPGKQTLRWFFTSSMARGRDYWMQPGHDVTGLKLIFLLAISPLYFFKVLLANLKRLICSEFSWVNVSVSLIQNVGFQYSRLRAGVIRYFESIT